MKYLFYDWGHVKEALGSAAVSLFLDYDGTLAPISTRPERALLTTARREYLQRLLDLPDCALSIVSGRSVSQLRQLVQIENISYIGNHGLEYTAPSGAGSVNIPEEPFLNLLAQVRSELYTKVNFITGIIIEDKGASVSVHFRSSPLNRIRMFLDIISEVMKKYTPDLKFSFGKCVVEIRPNLPQNKGVAVAKLYEQLPYRKEGWVPVCIGDDRTDEDMFEWIGSKGLAVRIGATSNSLAGYYVDTVSEVYLFLKKLYEIKTGKEITLA